MNVYDLLFWTLTAVILIDVLERPTLGRWILLGCVVGFGLENKISVCGSPQASARGWC